MTIKNKDPGNCLYNMKSKTFAVSGKNTQRGNKKINVKNKNFIYRKKILKQLRINFVLYTDGNKIEK